MIFRRPMDEEIRQMNQAAREVICVNVNGNCPEEVNQFDYTSCFACPYLMFFGRIELIFSSDFDVTNQNEFDRSLAA